LLHARQRSDVSTVGQEARRLQAAAESPEIARELSVSANTVRTHVRNLYHKLGAGWRAEAVNLARGLGLLAPSAGGLR
jgi:DNA-binding CsgD family transcriptional regulator